jgi:cytochrome c
MDRRLVMVVLTLALSACATLDTRKRDDPVKRGLQIAQRACATCHAIEAGDATSRARRAAPFASLEMRHTVGLEGRLAVLTSKGHYSMAPVVLTVGELADLRAYIESLHTH